MNNPNIPTKTGGISQQWQAVSWIVALLLAFGLGLGTGYLVWGKDAATAAGPAAATQAPAAAQAEADLPDTPQQVTRYDIPVDGQPALGPADAPITLVAFSDNECPFCLKWYAETWPLIQQNYGDRVRLVFRDFPLPNHPNAQPAAEAAACAFEQGKYWEFQDLIFNNTGILGDATYLKFAQQIGLDEAAFKTCYDEGRYRDDVTTDRDWASELGVSSTPTFFINGIALVGAQPYETFQQVIEMELAGKFTN
ncbi:MAG: thioredoxin domain-containing protein [Chloroflexi bacterium]|nr:thioredoxin domain-containing protein [Chloroflexota bacterium]